MRRIDWIMARHQRRSSLLVMWRIHGGAFVYGLLCTVLLSGSVHGWGIPWPTTTKMTTAPPNIDLEYDLVIIGAGASGLFASGAATMLGSRTLMVDLELDVSDGSNNVLTNVTSNIGGDCTNSACVPSKAVRSVARMAAAAASSNHQWKTTRKNNDGRHNFMALARRHATNTVLTVREREDPNAMVERNPNLDIALVSDCHFTSSNKLSLTVQQGYSCNNTNRTKIRALDSNTPTIVRSKKFLIATGASPVVPDHLENAAQAARIPTFTYQTLLRPSREEEHSIWQILASDDDNDETKRKHVVIAGGGATACELGQSLARLSGGNVIIDVVAPILLRGEDVTLQNAAAQILLENDNVNLHLGQRVQDVLANRTIRLSNGDIISSCDALVLCMGRKPGPGLARLNLQAANIQWNEMTGVTVKASNLQSISAPHVYACGDCCSAVASNPLGRTATHAAWTGYFAAANACLPRLLTMGSKAVHETVPRVIYTDPELASVGLSLEECVMRYGIDGFDRLMVPTAQTDRADMEVLERGKDVYGFIELRATKVDGKILGMTACGPAASELANELSVVLENGLRAIDMARSLHSYPSYGYILHRVALAIAFGNLWGSLEASGTIGGWVAWWGRKVSKGVSLAKKAFSRRKKQRIRRAWEAEGASRSLILLIDDDDGASSSRGIERRSFMDLANSKKWSTDEIKRRAIAYTSSQKDACGDFDSWLSRGP